MVVFALLLLGSGAIAQDQTSFQAEAVREYPALGQAGSDFNRRFIAQYQALKAANDPLLAQPDWPLVLAKQIAAQSSSTPPQSAQSTQPTTPAPAIGNAIANALGAATKQNPFVNSLGMKFVPIPGSKTLFSIWDTRVQDYRAYADANPDVDGGWKEPGFEQGDDHPVVRVNWIQATAFCAWLTQKEQHEGKIGQDVVYRLPTDAEWSAAAGDAKYPWGDDWPAPKGAGNYYPALQVDDFEHTSPVGSFSPNQYGLYDIGGNVWQWCQDWYRYQMNDASLLNAEPYLKNDGGGHQQRVIRGGSFNPIDPALLVTAVRCSDVPTQANGANGFRCVLGPPLPATTDGDQPP